MRGNQLYNEVFDKFSVREKDIRAGPVQRRTSCNDICCLLTFFLLMGAFLGIGIYYLVTANDILKTNWANNRLILDKPLTVIKELFVRYWPLIAGAFVLSLVLSFIYLCLLKSCTRCMVYSMIIATILVLLGLIGISIVNQAWATVAAAGVGLLFFLCFLCCFRNAIKKGIILLKATMFFISNRPSVYLVPILVIIFGLLFLAFWIITLLCMQQQSSILQLKQQAATKQIIFFIFWMFMIVFFAIFLYYVMVFLIGYMCAKWYYGHMNSGCCHGLGLLNRSSIGSITFITLTITFIKALRYLTVGAYQSQSAAGNSCTACCLCCLACCCAQIQYLITVLNQYAVLGMSLTGQAFIPSARTALSVIFKDFPLFVAATSLQQLMIYGAVVVTAGIPTLLAYLLLHLIYIRDSTIDSYELTIFIVLIFLLCVFISIFFLSVVNIAMSAVFFFFCLDRRYRQIGITIPNTPEVLRQLEDSPQFRYQYPDAYVPRSAERLY